MSDYNNHKIIYTAADIQRYLGGQMPPQEMHALESAALDDPFLADAIEGYKEHNPQKVTGTPSDVAELHQRLKTRIESPSRKIIPLFKTSWWKIAVMILVIAGAGTVVYYLTNKTETETPLIAKNQTPELKTSISDSSADAGMANQDTNKIAFNEPKLEERAVRPNKNNSSILSSPLPQEPLTSVSPPIPDAVAQQQDNTISRLSDSVESIASLNKRSIITRPEAKVEAPVTMQDNSAAKVTTNKVKIQNANKSSSVLDEVTSSKAAGLEVTSLKPVNAEPVIGFPAYNLYLDNNKKLYDSASIHGEVIVSFIINENGAISDYKIEKSLSRKTDNEAIRLIKEGPAWKVLKKRREVVTLTIKF